MDIHHYSANVEKAIGRFKQFRDGDVAVSFLNHLRMNGLTDARIWFYASRLKIVLEWFQSNNISIRESTRKDVENFLSSIYSKPYRAWTKHAYSILMKKLVTFAKTGKTEGVVEEVSWIKLSQFEKQAEKESRATPEALLTQDEFLKLVSATGSSRDRAILYVAFEGALRTGELLTMKVASVQFKKEYCLISVTGKTGVKRIPLVLSSPALLRWLSEHPTKENPSAWLWIDSKGDPLSVASYYAVLKRVSKKAGLHKKVWAYLLRHNRLTEMAKTLTETQLNLFAGWVADSGMPRKYVHFSARDLEDAILKINGIKPSEKEDHGLKLRACPRCGKGNSPEVVRCEYCGFILDQKLALQMEEQENKTYETRLDKLEEMVSKILSSPTEDQP